MLKFIGNLIYKWQRRKHNAILTDKNLEYLTKLKRVPRKMKEGEKYVWKNKSKY